MFFGTYYMILGWKLSPVVFYRWITARNTTWLSFQPNTSSLHYVVQWEKYLPFSAVATRPFAVLLRLFHKWNKTAALSISKKKKKKKKKKKPTKNQRPNSNRTESPAVDIMPRGMSSVFSWLLVNLISESIWQTRCSIRHISIFAVSS